MGYHENGRNPMKKSVLSLLLGLCVLLSGCGGRAVKSRILDFSRDLREREQLSFTAEIRAEYPEKRSEFSLSYESDESGETMRVLEPELIRGIGAHLAPGSSTLEYDGMILDLGPLDPNGLSPLTALPLLVDTLKNGHLDSTWEEGGQPAAKLIRDDTLSVQVWFSPETMTPVRAELSSGDTVKLFCELSDWS